jgi:hypothetical protein
VGMLCLAYEGLLELSFPLQSYVTLSGYSILQI